MLHRYGYTSELRSSTQASNRGVASPRTRARGTCFSSMSSQAGAPKVDCEMLHPTLPVNDVRAAVAFYTDKLGFQRGFEWGDPPSMAGVNLGGVSMHFTKGAPNPAGCSVYFVVDDVDALHAFQRENAVEVLSAPEDRPWGLRDYKVRDPYGYELGFGQRLRSAGARLPIERVELTVRMEKRLVALLRELAEHKGMTVGACLEETLLHSFEPLGAGAASPHAKKTQRYIQELRQKHGIDYDAHGAYRFVEKA